MSDALHERRHSWMHEEAGLVEEAGFEPAPTVASLSYWHALDASVITEAMADEEPVQDVAAASFSDLFTLEVVIGNDDRVKVDAASLKRNPWRQICALRIRSQTNKVFVGTAWFIAPGVLATAGHCVFMRKEKGWATSIDVIPARHGDQEPYGRIKATRFGSVRGWVEKGLRTHDYGVIFLEDTTAGDAVGNFAVEAPLDAELKKALANISGYPADRDSAQYQYFHARELTGSSAAQLEYEIDSFGGQSGSPIWLDRGNGDCVAIGIHTTGSQVGNSGTRVSEPVLDNLIKWVEGDFA